MKVDLEKLAKLKEKGYVYYKEHPVYSELRLYKYLPLCTYLQAWDEETRICRGLVVDNEGNCINSPLPKAFNIEEHLGGSKLPDSKGIGNVDTGEVKVYVNNISVKGTLPKNERIKLFEKADGSLILCTIYKDNLLITSSGSFDSEHAQTATEWFNTRYSHVVPLLDKGKTYCFEFIHPTYRIVVDYGDKEELVLLAVRDNDTGKDYDINDYIHLGFRLPKTYDVNSIEDILNLQKQNIKNEEGFIAVFESGFRTKIKFEDYLNLHRFKSETRLIDLWQLLQDNKDVYETLNNVLSLVEDEFYDKLTVHINNFKKKFIEIENEVKIIYDSILSNEELKDRKSQAQYIIKNHSVYRALLFKLLDNKDISTMIWDMLEPNKTDRLF